MNSALSREPLLTLAHAARKVPGGPVHVSTIHRWRLSGIRGVRLETIMRGGRRMTSLPALERFFAATTAAADGNSAPSNSSIGRDAEIAAAERELAEAGI